MDISAIGSSPLQGIQRGFAGLDANATRIASAGQLSSPEATGAAPKVSLERTLVGLQQNTQGVQASVKALSAENTMLGYLLDVTA